MSAVGGWSVAFTIARRELIRFARQPAQILAALGTPALLWIFVGSGVGESFQPAAFDSSYSAFLLPGMMTLIAVFTAVLSIFSLI